MSLLYNLALKHHPGHPEEDKKIYLILRNLEKLGVDEIAEEISKKLNIQKDLCRAVLNTWNEVAIDKLTHGHAVELGDAGYVYLTASSKGVDDENTPPKEMVKSINGRIRFSKKAQDAFNNAELISTKSLLSEQKLKEE